MLHGCGDIVHGWVVIVGRHGEVEEGGAVEVLHHPDRFHQRRCTVGRSHEGSTAEQRQFIGAALYAVPGQCRATVCPKGAHASLMLSAILRNGEFTYGKLPFAFAEATHESSPQVEQQVCHCAPLSNVTLPSVCLNQLRATCYGCQAIATAGRSGRKDSRPFEGL